MKNRTVLDNDVGFHYVVLNEEDLPTFVLYKDVYFMNVFRIHFTWKEKEYTLKAHSLDMTHPYFVSIKDLILPQESSLLINPADDELRKQFSEVRQLMLPFQNVSLIEEFRYDPDQDKSQDPPAKGEVVISDLFSKRKE